MYSFPGGNLNLSVNKKFFRCLLKLPAKNLVQDSNFYVQSFWENVFVLDGLVLCKCKRPDSKPMFMTLQSYAYI